MGKSFLARVPAPVKLGVPVAAGLLAAACSSAAGTLSGSAPASSGTSGGSTSGTVIETHSGSGGTFLTDGTGRTVYLWVKDGMNKSTCTGACASAWPPVMDHGQLTASGGAKASDLGTIARPGGGKQVTYDGHALYYFAATPARARPVARAATPSARSGGWSPGRDADHRGRHGERFFRQRWLQLGR